MFNLPRESHRLYFIFTVSSGWERWFDGPLSRFVTHGAMSWLIGGGNAHRPPLRATRGIRTAQQFSWEMMAQDREAVYAHEMWQRLNGYSAYDDVPITSERIHRWHPLNQSLYAAYKVMLPGLLLQAKGDRATRLSSTEGRYPFLDENVVQFCAELAPEYKLRRWSDKWLLRQVAAKILPKLICRRPKTMFRANLGRAFLGPHRPTWVDASLRPDSLRATGYFDPDGVARAREIQNRRPRLSLLRFALDMGLAGVISTQLWNHMFCGGGSVNLRTWSPPQLANRPLHGPNKT